MPYTRLTQLLRGIEKGVVRDSLAETVPQPLASGFGREAHAPHTDGGDRLYRLRIEITHPE